VSEKKRADLLQGTLDLLVLRALQRGPLHGWGITERLESASGDLLQIGQGSLYPALYRLEQQGYVTSSWAATENNRRARYYELTSAGRARLVEERQAWRRMARAVELILGMDG
jgi:transcriptional regulator